MSLPFQTERPSRARVGNMVACDFLKLLVGEDEKIQAGGGARAESAFVCGHHLTR